MTVLLGTAPLCAQQSDWLLDPSPYRAELHEQGKQIVLENGLLRLRIQQDPLALVGIEQITSGQQLLRAAAPLGRRSVYFGTENHE